MPGPFDRGGNGGTWQTSGPYPNGVPANQCMPPAGVQTIYAPPGSAPYAPPPSMGGAPILLPPPWTTEPYRTYPFDQSARVVLNAPSGSTLGTAGATRIADAEVMGSSTALTILPSTADATNVEQTVLTTTVPQGMRLRIAGWGAEIGHSAFEKVLFRLVVGSQVVIGPVQLAAFGDLVDLASIFALGLAGQAVRVLARNADDVAPQYVAVRVYGWLWRSLTQDDSIRGAMGENPYAIDSNGRFGMATCPPDTLPCPPTGRRA